MTTKHVRWQVMPAHTPRLARHCAHCDQLRPFQCHERFRINAQKRKLDVWLLYKCSVCGATWNLEIAARVSPQDIEPSQLRSMEANDAALAWYYAFDVPTLRRSGAEIQYPTDYQVLGQAIDWELEERLLTVELEFPFRFDLRLDRLLQQQLSRPRTQIHRLAASGAIVSEPVVDIKRHKIRDTRLQITIDPCAVRAVMGS